MVDKQSASQLRESIEERRLKQKSSNHPGRIHDFLNYSEINDQTKIIKRDLIKCMSWIEGGYIWGSLDGESFKYPIILKETVQFILSHDQFIVNEVAGDQTNKVKENLIKNFIRTGLLQIDLHGG